MAEDNQTAAKGAWHLFCVEIEIQKPDNTKGTKYLPVRALNEQDAAAAAFKFVASDKFKFHPMSLKSPRLLEDGETCGPKGAKPKSEPAAPKAEPASPKAEPTPKPAKADDLEPIPAPVAPEDKMKKGA